MFPDFGSLEILLILVVTLLVIGPEKLPETLRALGLWFGRLSRSFNSVKSEIEKEIGMDDVRRQLHNEAVMQEMKRIEEEVKGAIDPVTQPVSIDPAADHSETTEIDSAPKPVSEAELEAQHASKLKQASAGNNQEV
ncbi:MAG TPA: twin-arginine translocase subunit TatB [Gammaproteobacteria bacterium]|jgi:sec-independent protein translocase protein TatB|nr:twin-arginine translocase subunit TatB [Gammaproteobacteria bacterium]HBF63128.1 twin-arginine translocase subunit TatB [Gammaproteobacteria bacterium]HBK12863.1 twin-arginine translocase subunit TatB [Gammaproteobacteria bacterium]|tara:strand:- start:1636 stop:2046 length:411 start_codon:yes stop_codon:yes gene_type:complete